MRRWQVVDVETGRHVASFIDRTAAERRAMENANWRVFHQHDPQNPLNVRQSDSPTGRRGDSPTQRDEPLAAYLAPKGRAPGIGLERGTAIRDGIARFRSPHGSTRYIFYREGEPLAVLQVVSRDGKHATIANVYVRPEARRKGLASRLLARARRDFQSVEHASESHLSAEGRAWKEAVRDVRSNSRRYLVYLGKVEGAADGTYYVGSTARGLRLRRRQHRSGRMSHRHCVGKLVPVMRVGTRAEAEAGEARVARMLRARGYTVHGDY